MKTELIKYNLKERGRKHRGQERNFDIPRIAATINSRETQERVKNRDMLGYYGHWSRIKFGMNPQEGKIDSGQVIHVEPAIVTTHLKAFPDGTIEHQAEFLPTKSGELAAKLFAGKAGGFSSAIDTLKPEFHGFDYVLEPNYTTNRGYTFDSVCEGGLCGALTLDEVETAVYEEQMAGMMRLVNGFDEFKQFAMDAIDSLQKENKAEQEKNAFRYVKPKMIPIKKFKSEPKFTTNESHKNAILDSANRFRDDLSVDRFAAGLMVENMIKNKAPKPSQQDVFLNGLIKGFTKQWTTKVR